MLCLPACQLSRVDPRSIIRKFVRRAYSRHRYIYISWIIQVNLYRRFWFVQINQNKPMWYHWFKIKLGAEKEASKTITWFVRGTPSPPLWAYTDISSLHCYWLVIIGKSPAWPRVFRIVIRPGNSWYQQYFSFSSSGSAGIDHVLQTHFQGTLEATQKYKWTFYMLT